MRSDDVSRRTFGLTQRGLQADLRRTFTAFFDTEDVAAGVSFEERIESELTAAHAVLVVIGPDWLEPTCTPGHRRIDDPADFVHQEVRSALNNPRQRVVPVRVDNALIPAAGDLPEPLRKLAGLQFRRVQHESWSGDVARLTRELKADRLVRRSARCRRGVLAAALLALVVRTVVERGPRAGSRVGQRTRQVLVRRRSVRPGVEMAWTLVAEGSDLSMFLDGRPVIGVKDSTHARGAFYLRLFPGKADATVRYRDLRIWTR